MVIPHSFLDHITQKELLELLIKTIRKQNLLTRLSEGRTCPVIDQRDADLLIFQVITAHYIWALADSSVIGASELSDDDDGVKMTD